MNTMAYCLALSAFVFLVWSQSCPTGMSTKEAQDVLTVHNKLRGRLRKGKFTAKGEKVPAAKKLPNLEWDCELARSSQVWANNCKRKHTDIENIGENLYYYSHSRGVTEEGSGKAASKMWEEEFQEFGWPDVPVFTRRASSVGINHATQMVWANTTKIGCATAKCDNSSWLLLVCQYINRGNWINEKVYEPKE